MENASHAIMIAAGILLAMVITGLLLFAYKNYSNYKKSEYETTRQDQVTAANKELESYNRKSIKGLQLLSLINTVADHNNENLRKENNTEDMPIIKLYIAVRVESTNNNKVYDTADSIRNKKDSGLFTDPPKYADYDGVPYCLVNTTTYGAKDYADTKKVLNGRYFECTEIKYEPKSGYITEIYIKEVVKK